MRAGEPSGAVLTCCLLCCLLHAMDRSALSVPLWRLSGGDASVRVTVFYTSMFGSSSSVVVVTRAAARST